MRTFGFAFLGGIVGYIAGTGLGIGLVQAMSSNRHDRTQEAVMTGFLVTGPVLAILAFVGTLIVMLVRGRAG